MKSRISWAENQPPLPLIHLVQDDALRGAG